MHEMPVVTIITSILLIVCVTFSYMQHPKFGQLPKGGHLREIKTSPNYKNGEFRNIEEKPPFTNKANILKILWELNANINKNKKPLRPIPSESTNINNIPPHEDYFIWFGHSSYLLQLNGKRFLVDPVFSTNAAPVPFMVKAFKGTSNYTPHDMPFIDYLIITHDHWDHLDYKTVIALKNKVDTVICPLGVGSHFKHWKYDKSKILEKDWGEKHLLTPDLTIHCVTSHHFSGRGLKRNQTLWASFIIQSADFKIFLGCDGGYGKHFKEIYRQHGAFDLAILENGQYNKYWEHIHSTPEKTIQTALDLHAKNLIPIHYSKFSLSSHSWLEPINSITKHINKYQINLATPKIGQIVFLSQLSSGLEQWWQMV